MSRYDVTIKIVREDGHEFHINNTEWTIPSNGLKGLGEIMADVYTQNLAMEDGVYVTGQRIPNRNITIKCRNAYASLNREVRDYVIRFFKPKVKYNLFINYNRNEKWIECYLTTLSMPSENIYRNTELTLNFLCPSPYFRSMREYTIDVLGAKPRWGFPYIATENITPKFSVKGSAEYTFLENNGTVDVPFKVKMWFDELDDPYTKGIVISVKHNGISKIFSFTTQDSPIAFPSQIIEVDFADKMLTIDGSKRNTSIYIYESDFDITIPISGAEFTVKLSGALSEEQRAYYESRLHCEIYYNELYGGM